jgi:hypothetical protein
LSRPVTASAADLTYIDRQDAVAFWLAYSFAFDDTEPLPSMFRRKTPAVNAEAPFVTAVHSEDMTVPAARMSIHRISNMMASYILAGVLLLFAAMDATLLTMARFSPDQAVSQSTSEIGVVETARLSPSTEAAEASEAPAIEQAGNGQLPRQMEASVAGSTEKPIEAANVCAVKSLNCWKSATFIR